MERRKWELFLTSGEEGGGRGARGKGGYIVRFTGVKGAKGVEVVQ